MQLNQRVGREGRNLNPFVAAFCLSVGTMLQSLLALGLHILHPCAVSVRKITATTYIQSAGHSNPPIQRRGSPMNSKQVDRQEPLRDLPGRSEVVEGCSSCAAVTINGVYCHEHGCPDAWQDETRECRQCGLDFKPESARQVFCTCIHDE